MIIIKRRGIPTSACMFFIFLQNPNTQFANSVHMCGLFHRWSLETLLLSMRSKKRICLEVPRWICRPSVWKKKILLEIWLYLFCKSLPDNKLPLFSELLFIVSTLQPNFQREDLRVKDHVIKFLDIVHTFICYFQLYPKAVLKLWRFWILQIWFYLHLPRFCAFKICFTNV